MITEIAAGLRDWVVESLGDAGVTVSFEAPGKIAALPAVGLYLFEVVPVPLSRAERRPPLQLALHYLVTAWADHAERAHELLVKLMLRAMDGSRWHVEDGAFPIAPPSRTCRRTRSRSPSR